MIKIMNLDSCEGTPKGYGGHSGSKKSILIENERWLVKYPKSTKSMDVEGLSYTTTPLSEYLGSHIFELIGIDTHKTILGFSNGKLVVACKDFLKSTEEIIDFNAIKNNYEEEIETYMENRHSSLFDRYEDLNDIIFVMENNIYFDMLPELKKRFWEMFIVDALINNNDRNEANWGVILNKENMSLRIAPVFDNGASFYNKSDEEKFKNILQDPVKFKQLAYDSSVSAFVINEKIVNPLKYIESMQNKDCNDALLEIFPKMNLEEIQKMFDEIPFDENGVIVITKAQKDLYIKVLEYRINNVLKPVYNQLLEMK